MATPTSVPWGTVTLILDNEAFRRGFLAARRWYFEDIYGRDSRGPEEPQRATRLSSEEVLRLVVMPDQQGRYHFDEMGSENLHEYLGYLVGYLGGPLAPQEAEHETEPWPMTVLQEA
jgi:hypothetical protein